jgi:hypothetical protein
MTAQARVAKLEALLERIQHKRRRVVGGEAMAAAPAPAAAVTSAPVATPMKPAPERAPTPAPAVPKSAEIEVELRATPVPTASPVVSDPSLELDLGDDRARPPAPTPMEQALGAVPRSEPEISIDDGPEITFGDEDDEADDDSLDLGGGLSSDAAPTAPIGTRAPAPEPAKPAAAPAQVVAARAPQPSQPQPIALATASPAASVARVVARPEPVGEPTFGELLARTLALRPKP